MSSPDVVQAVALFSSDGQLAKKNDGLPTLRLTPQQNLVAQVKAAWGLDVWLLHDGGLNVGQGGLPHFEVLTGTLPAGLRWTRSDLPAPHRARRWQLPGWPAQARALAGRAGLSGPVEQVFTTDLNTVLQVGAPPTPAYLKVTDSGKEMRVTAYLARTHPEALPPVLDVNEAENCQLVASGGVLLDSVGNLNAWTQALERLAGFQTGADARALAALGCPVYPLAEMRERVLHFIADEQVLRDWGLPTERIQTLQDSGVRARIEQAFTQLDALGLPELPSHGDAHPRNALYGERGAVWFDWSEAAIAHPFMDAGWLLSFTLHPSRADLPIRQAVPDLQTPLAGAYLRALGCPGAERFLNQAIPLALLHRAAVYDLHFRHWEGTVPGWRPNYVPYYLREALRELERLH